MTDWDAIEDALYDWAFAQLGGVFVMWAEQNAAPKSNPYATLRLSSTTRVGEDFSGAPDSGTGIADLTGNRDFMLEVQTLGAGAKANIEKLRASLQKTQVLAALRADGVVFVEEVAQNNITEVVAGTTKYEAREFLDLMMRTASVDTDDVGVVEHVELTEKVLDPAGNTVIEETTTINP